mmetsp:Transcript_29727/g.90414  ORF Transcript_29727/g.90414 Transcript_29727/m.90414 type:complete len:219 (+) Transcript_29727:378-1034(+)
MRGTLTTTALRSSSCTSTAAPSWTWTSPSGSVAPSARTTRAARTRRSSTRARLSPPGCGRSRDSSSPLRSGRRSSSSSRRWRGARPSRSISPRRPSPSSASTAGTRCRGGPTQTATARRRATPTPGLWRRRGQPEPTSIYSRARVVSRGVRVARAVDWRPAGSATAPRGVPIASRRGYTALCVRRVAMDSVPVRRECREGGEAGDTGSLGNVNVEIEP